jgi:hypothetical protein
MNEMLGWMEAHEKLAGWAQALGAFLAIMVAYGLTILQARYAVRQEERRTAERLKALARTLQYWRNICERSWSLREHESSGQDVDRLNINLSEFNYTASEINKFGFADAPNELVLRALTKYRAMCAPLSNFMSPSYKAPLSAGDLSAFDGIIDELGELARGLEAEAERMLR